MRMVLKIFLPVLCAALLPLSSALGEAHDPQPYSYCYSSTFKRNTGLKVVITTTKRDMSKMTRRQLAETALSAARHYSGNHAVVNVLLSSSCTGAEICWPGHRPNGAR